MIILNERNPSNSLYYLGGKILLHMFEFQDGVSALDLYDEIKADLKISFYTMALTLDWLFMINAVEISNGRLKNVSQVS